MPLSRSLLRASCWFGVAAGTWLAVMENVLRHEGYAGRTAVAACIVLQSLATLLFIGRRGGWLLRGAVMAGAFGIVWLGFSAISKVLSAQHFEGFVVVIGCALIVQGGLTLWQGIDASAGARSAA
jgi:hypothetical protein